jgi:predicted ATP-binding protein involved in virulence
MFSSDKDKGFTVLIDELENHLHPTMQRRILPDLVKAFPRVSFIASTHSPLIVNSVRDANVYALRYSKDKRVYSQKLDFSSQAKTAMEILDEVLGVSFTMPIWAEEKMDALITRLDMKNITKDDLVTLRENLKEL